MLNLRQLHPQAIASLRNFCADLLAPDSPLESGSAEIFLSLTEGESKPTVLLLHDSDGKATQERIKKIAEKSNGRTVWYHLRQYPASERSALYTRLGGGQSLYLHPAALRDLSQLRVAGDPYGLLKQMNLYGLLLLSALFLMVGLLDRDLWGTLLMLICLLAAYWLIYGLIHLRPIREALARRRKQDFAAVLESCETIGRPELDPDLAAALPERVAERLSRLPDLRPGSGGLPTPGEWRAAEIWDLAHEAAETLGRLPASSPGYPAMQREVEQLLDLAHTALGEVATTDLPGDPATPTNPELAAIYQDIRHHAAALGLQALSSPAEAAQPSPQRS